MATMTRSHHRRSIRLPAYDYAGQGMYFVTICTQHKACLLGDILGDAMHPNDAGRMVERWWHELPRKYPTIDIDAYVIMPNHFHGLITIHGSVGADLRSVPRPQGVGLCVRPALGRPRRVAPTLGNVVAWFKTMCTNEYIRGVTDSGWPAFAGRLWQRSYYEHIVRNEDDLRRIQEYIANNPARWAEDEENPAVARPIL